MHRVRSPNRRVRVSIADSWHSSHSSERWMRAGCGGLVATGSARQALLGARQDLVGAARLELPKALPIL